MTVHDKIADAQAAAVASIEQVDDLESLIALEPSLFGKKSELSSLKRLMGKVEEEERAGVGQALNEAQRIVRAAHAVARERFLTATRRVQLEAERLDLSESRDSNDGAFGRCFCRDGVHRLRRPPSGTRLVQL